MTAPLAGTAPSPNVVLRVIPFYAAMFLPQGVASVFAGIWFASRGFTESEIGILNAAPVLVLLALNLWVGRIADRAEDWRGVIVIGAMASGIGALLLPAMQGFWAILLAWTLTFAAFGAVLPVCDAATMRLSRRAGFDYSAVRAWASVGYLIMLLATGFLLSRFGAWMFLPLFCATSLIRSGAAVVLPRFRAPAEERTPGPGARSLMRALRPWFLLPLIGGAIIYGTHQVLGAFQALLWADQGLSASTIAVLIGLGAASEVVVFFLYPRLGGRISARWLILVSAAVAAGRWAIYGFSPPVALLVPLQLLHGITFGFGFLGCITFIANWTSEDIAAEAQSFFVMLQQGFSVLALLAFGWLAGSMGAHAYIPLGLVAACGAALVWLSLRLQHPKPSAAA
jgi:PPP family 3-phenylpropionic acid transporter